MFHVCLCYSYTASEADKIPEQRAQVMESKRLVIIPHLPLVLWCKLYLRLVWYGCRQELVLLDNEIAFNEAVIEEREQGIQEIHTQIGEVNEIFKDLAVLVNDQGVMIGKLIYLTTCPQLCSYRAHFLLLTGRWYWYSHWQLSSCNCPRKISASSSLQNTKIKLISGINTRNLFEHQWVSGFLGLHSNVLILFARRHACSWWYLALYFWSWSSYSQLDFGKQEQEFKCVEASTSGTT